MKHNIENIQQKIKDYNTKISMILRDLTRYLQPLANKSTIDSKMTIEKYTEYCMEQEESNAKVPLKDIINWAEEVRYADKLSL